MFYNHTKRELRETQKLIKKLNQRHTSLTKKGYKNLPQTKEYEELFKKIGGDENTRVQKSGNINLSTSKAFIDSLTEDDLKKLDELDKKNYTVIHIEDEKAKKIKEENPNISQKEALKKAREILKKENFNQTIYDNLGVLYNDEKANTILQSRYKTKSQINYICSLLGLEPLYKVKRRKNGHL